MRPIKSSLILSLAMWTMASNVQAHGFNYDAVMGHITEHHHHHHHHEVDNSSLLMARHELMAHLPAEPDKALDYLVGFLNQGELKENGRNMVYSVKYVENLEDGKMLDVQTRFTDENKIYFDLVLKKSLAKNPVYMMEALKTLQGFLSESFQVTSSEKVSYLEYLWVQHPHHGWVQDKKHHKTVHYMNTTVHSVIGALGVIGQNDYGDKPLAWAERSLNAQKGSAYAQREIKSREMKSNSELMASFPKFELLKELNEAEQKAALSEMAKAANLTLNEAASASEMAIEYYSKRGMKIQKELEAADKAAREQYAKEKKWFDNEGLKENKNKLEVMAMKLDDFVKNNDRESVARLFEAFLPIEIMEPVEKGLWQDWIEAIRHPDTKNARLYFRGLDAENDKPQIAYDSAKKPVGYGFFPTLLIRNQGNYTRRLRSYSTMRYRFQNQTNQEKSPVEMAPTITALMSNHSGNPTGSPVMSFSTNIEIARAFSSSGIIAAKIDPRRVMPNIMSGFNSELEILVPLVVFPDEVIAVEMKGPQEESINHERFVEKLNARLGHDYTEEVVKGNREVYVEAYRIFSNAQDSNAPLCKGIFN